MKNKRLWTLMTALLMVLVTVAGLCVFSSADEPSVYLSDLTPTVAQAGWRDVRFDENLNGGKLKLNNAGNPITYEKGVFAHVNSLVEYDITDMKAKKFTAYIGINEGNQGYEDQASADFEVKVDGTSLYKSPILKFADEALFIEVEIPEGAKKLTLITTKADHTDYADHTAWCDAKLILDPSTGGILNALEASVNVGVLKCGESTKISAKALSYSNDVIENSKLTLSFSSSNPAVATVSSDGTVTAVADGSVQITVRAEKDGKTVEDTVMLSCIGEESTKAFLLSSPNENLQILLSNTANGLKYSVYFGGKTVLEPSPIGFKGQAVNFTSGFAYSSKSDVKEIDETYKKYSGSFNSGHDHCNEQSVTFTIGDYFFTVILRAYDDGFAYRTVIERKDGSEQSIVITDETSGFTFPSGSTIWASELSGGDLERGYSYESGFPAYLVDNTAGKYLAFASLVRVEEDLYTLINEAELFGDLYYGSLLYGVGERTLELHPAPMAASSVTIKMDPQFTAPWRYGVVGDLETIVENDLIENLNERTTEDFSWVRPGVTAWMWLSEGFQGQRTESTLKKYVDLAHDMGWTYLILDEGWQPAATSPGKVYEGYFSYFDDLVEYAAEKDVYFIAWVKMRDLDTVEELSLLEEWADKGIKGIKVDFIESEGVDRIEIMERIYQKCADEKLIVNVHGFNKSTGEISRWPNIINRESLKGQEYGGVWCTDTTIWPYTRAVTGAMDITPHLYPTTGSSTTAAQQLALNIVFESGMPCMASNPQTYYNSNAKFLLKNLPSSWDELEFIDGSVAGYTVLARRKGNDWYIGGLTQSEAKVSVTLDFLEEGEEYIAVVYEDGKDRNDIAVRNVKVKAGDTLELKMANQGGCSVIIQPADETVLATDITVDKTVLTMKKGESEKVTFTILPLGTDLSDLKIHYGDASVARLLEDGTIEAKGAGVTEISYELPSAGLKASVEVRVYSEDGENGKAEYALKVGRSMKVVAGKIIGNEPLTALTYSVGNSAIAKVEADGTVYGIKPGVTLLTAKNEKTGQSEQIVLWIFTELSADSGIWQLVNENQNKLPVVSVEDPNMLEMTILTGDIANKLQNLFVTAAPSGDFSFTVKISGGLSKDFQSAGLVAYVDDQNLAAVERRHHSYFGGNVFCISTFTDNYVEHPVSDEESFEDAYLKMEKKGNVFTGYYSVDGAEWIEIGSITSKSVASGKLKIGLVARSGSYSAEEPVLFTDFKVDGQLVRFIPEKEGCQFVFDGEKLVVESAKELPEKLNLYFNTGVTEEVSVTYKSQGQDLSKAGSYEILAETADGFSAKIKVEIKHDSDYVEPTPTPTPTPSPTPSDEPTPTPPTSEEQPTASEPENESKDPPESKPGDDSGKGEGGDNTTIIIVAVAIAAVAVGVVIFVVMKKKKA